MSGHTPGPWCAVDVDHAVAICTVDGHTVADVFAMADAECGVTTDANARLVAAAPDLLEALQEAHEALDGVRPYTVGLMNAINSAIAKATGAA